MARSPIPRPFRTVLPAAAVLAAVTGLVLAPSGFADSSHAVPVVHADAGAASAATTSAALGMNVATWDQHLLDPGIPDLLSKIHVGVLRYPGGSTSDDYDWKSSTSGGQKQSNDYRQFDRIADQVGAQPLFTVNYGSGTPEHAAAWVKDFLAHPTAKQPMWEIGNEVYGPWEKDQHADPHTPESYVQNAEKFIDAIHKVDPHAKIGVPYTLTTEQATGTGTGVDKPEDWNTKVLSALGDKIDFVDMHWYPFYGTPHVTNDEIMAQARRVPAVMESIRTNIRHYAPGAKVLVGETNMSQTPLPQDNQPIAALYTASTLLQYLVNGATSVDWWDLHDYGFADKEGDFSVLSTGRPGEPPVNTPMPTYSGYRMASMVAGGGFTLSTLASPEKSVDAFTATRGDTRRVLLANSADTARTVKLKGLSGRNGQHLHLYTYSAAHPSVTAMWTGAGVAAAGLTLPAQSITVVSTNAVE
ncbi:hypothetical protein AB0436_06360 [Streptomyces sp. NPDC051322]|uniref:hypothetical protein n=1 Tax=Streptomyces sp. NPDC051322 TaxID=3154645 RepID=UPI00344D0FC8